MHDAETKALRKHPVLTRDMADHTMPVKGRNGVQQPRTEEPSCFILRYCVLTELHFLCSS